MRRCSNASERIFSIERLSWPTGALFALVLAAGVAPVSAPTPAANQGDDVSTRPPNVHPRAMGQNRASA
ncbi:MAG: hypothetical protein VYB88_03570, partial [Pseudomonadota bacterium]|nr:hypothetical protein [Pseudomonadota bacterium]